MDGTQIAAYASQITTSNYLYSGKTVTYSEEIGGTNALDAAFAGTKNEPAKIYNMWAKWNNTVYYSPTITTDWSDTNAGKTKHYGDKSVYPDQSNSYINVWDTRY